SRHFVRTRGGRTWDLRGLALGLVGVCVAVTLSSRPIPVLRPAQLRAMEGLLRLRNEPVFSKQGLAFAGVTADSRRASQIVLVEMDPVARRRAMTETSEAALIAQTAERLSRWKPQRIIVPAPQLHESWPTGPAFGSDAPTPGPASVSRNRADLPDLEAALRKHPEIWLSVPDLSLANTLPLFSHTNTYQTAPELPLLDLEVLEELQRLLKAASTSGGGSLDRLAGLSLPAIRIDDHLLERPSRSDHLTELRPLPLLLVAASRKMGGVEPVVRPDGVQLGDLRIPTIAPNFVLVDYGGAERASALPRVAYSTVLAGTPIYEPAPEAPSNQRETPGRSPRDFFAGKIVILAPLTEPSLETPVGRLTNTELLAEATQTLISGAFIRPAPLWVMFALMLVLCINVGRGCVGVTPLTATWRAGIAVLTVLILSPLAIASGVWLDPVTPAAAVLITAVLVTQFTFGLEQSERRRQRDLLDRVAAPRVVEELLDRTERLALGGERREVCILFADVRNFTPFAERHTAEQVIEVINRYTTAMTEALLAHNGILDRYTGDGLVARFDVVHSPEDAVQAVAAALAIRDAAEALAQEMQSKGEPDLRIGLGLHVGEAVVGLVGSPTQFHYTAMGHSVVVAARLQGFAEGGEVLISDAVYALVHDHFHCQAREPMWLKGLSEPVQTYRVLGSRL
ncbi:MAG: adenylate/guanylate cyclase domain-containing protein, partial [Actinomycetota bacterium]